MQSWPTDLDAPVARARSTGCSCGDADDRVQRRAPLLVVLTGPTGSGKSDLALELGSALEPRAGRDRQRRFGAGVSRHGHRHRQAHAPRCAPRMPHHLIDIRDPAESYSAGEFVRDARSCDRAPSSSAVICRCWSAARCSICARCSRAGADAGGLGAAAAETRCAGGARGWPALHAELARVDAGCRCAHRPQDPQRIQRALEVYRLTGVPIVALAARDASRSAPSSRWLRYALLADRASSCACGCARASTRCSRRDWWMRCARLYARGDLTRSIRRSARSVTVSCGGFVPAVSLRAGEQQALAATRQLAKRQMTWLRREPELTAADRHRL